MFVRLRAAQKISKQTDFYKDLQSFSVSQNIIGNSGICLFLEGIKQMASSLQILNFSNTKIGDTAVDKLCELLNSGFLKLRILDLSSNFITESGGLRLLNSIQSMSTLKKVNLSKNYICSEFQDFLEEKSKDIPALQNFQYDSQKCLKFYSNCDAITEFYDNHYQIQKRLTEIWVQRDIRHHPPSPPPAHSPSPCCTPQLLRRSEPGQMDVIENRNSRSRDSSASRRCCLSHFRGLKNLQRALHKSLSLSLPRWKTEVLPGQGNQVQLRGEFEDSELH